MSSLDTLSQPLIRSMGDCAYDTFKRIWKSNRYHEVGWLLLALLDKVEKEKCEGGNSNFQLKPHLSDLKTYF